ILQLIPFRGPVLADQHGSASGTVYLLDRETTYRLYRQAAEQGDAAAQALVGGMYLVGEGVPRDYAEAAKWYRKAAEQGNADAQYNLGGLYANGQGVPRDCAEAAKWYRKAAEQGNADAQYDLGVMYADGQGVPRDYVLAYMLFDLAATSFEAANSRDTATKDRDFVASKATPAQIAEARRLAREWKSKMGK
ncbi:MAG: tetratricopeptide repeat protein, partial [Syntrophaceae bacterium]